MSDSVSMVWFRFDLRLADNYALAEAVANGRHLIPVFIWSPGEEGHWAPGSASKWWLHQSLQRLSERLAQAGSPLIIRSGPTLKVINELIQEAGVDSVYWNRRFDPIGRKIDESVQNDLEKNGIAVHTFNSALLHEPDRVRTKSGTPFKVFTPFWNHFTATIEPKIPVGEPKRILASPKKIRSMNLEELELQPVIDWASGFRETFSPGEEGAHKRFAQFLNDGIAQYSRGRDLPSQDGVSMMSPHLHFGEISARQIWHGVKAHRVKPHRVKPAQGADPDTYLKEIGWREFAHHILFHFPHTSDNPLREQFSKFPWSNNATDLKNWQKGFTGYPIVDAGMRQLWHTGWMHNRVRMIVASFLTKDLLITWKHGAEWFWDTLVDADLANNTLGWQWASGCGADAAPYFRIFNPELQGAKFDPDGHYVKRWVPELSGLDKRWIHKPSRAPSLVLAAAGIELGKTYPEPIVDHSLARIRALEALSQIKVDKSAHDLELP